MNNPVAQNQRIVSLDVLRGFALLGILIINIQSFAMPGTAYLNPSSFGDLTGINKWVWMISHGLADTKMMAIFSTLFGAGIMLLVEKSKSKSKNLTALHFQRMFWLLVFGLIHAHLIWHGDILVAYAICGMFVYLFRNKSIKALLIYGFIFISVHTLIYGFIQSTLHLIPESDLIEMAADWTPPKSVIQEEIDMVTWSIPTQIGFNSKAALFMETVVFALVLFWRAFGRIWYLSKLQSSMEP